MKATRMIAAALMALPALALAQQTPTPAKADLKALFGVMTANVAQITAAGEKERWMANTEMWELKLASTGVLPQETLDRMTAVLGRIKANVAVAKGLEEKGRWQANITLWQALIAGKGAFAKADLDTVKAPFDAMKSNVAAITEPGERQRWTANRDMWQIVIDHATMVKAVAATP